MAQPQNPDTQSTQGMHGHMQQQMDDQMQQQQQMQQMDQAAAAAYHQQMMMAQQQQHMMMTQAQNIDGKLVTEQKNRALKELESRIRMALKQHEDMYKIQRQHVDADHNRQLQMAKSGIEANRQAELMQLDQDFQRGLMGLQQNADSQSIAIEAEAASLSIQSLQHKLMQQHDDKSKTWTLTNDMGLHPALLMQQNYEALNYAVGNSGNQQ